MTTVNPQELAKAIELIKPAITKNYTIPICEEIFVEFKTKGLMTLTATDLNNWGVTNCSYTGDPLEPFIITTKAAIVLKDMKGSAEIFRNTDGSILITAGKEKLKLNSYNAPDFPKTPSPEFVSRFSMSAAEFKETIKDHLGYVSNDDLRPSMMCINIKRDETKTIKFASTDGHRLLLSEFEDTDSEELYSMNLKANGTLIKNLSGDVLVDYCEVVKEEFDKETNHKIKSYSPGYIRFTDSNGLQIISRHVDEKYPQYENAIPQHPPLKCTVKKADVIKSFKKGINFANKTTHKVEMKISESECSLFYEDFDSMSEYSETINCTTIIENPPKPENVYSKDEEGKEVVTMVTPEITPDIHIGFNMKFFADILSSVKGDNFDLFLSQPNRAVYIKEENKLILVMPVMIQ